MYKTCSGYSTITGLPLNIRQNLLRDCELKIYEIKRAGIIKCMRYYLNVEYWVFWFNIKDYCTSWSKLCCSRFFLLVNCILIIALITRLLFVSLAPFFVRLFPRIFCTVTPFLFLHWLQLASGFTDLFKDVLSAALFCMHYMLFGVFVIRIRELRKS